MRNLFSNSLYLLYTDNSYLQCSLKAEVYTYMEEVMVPYIESCIFNWWETSMLLLSLDCSLEQHLSLGGLHEFVVIKEGRMSTSCY